MGLSTETTEHCTVLTGATGFVGSAIIERLRLEQGNKPANAPRLRACARNVSGLDAATVEPVHVPEITGDTDWKTALQGADVVIHAAARVHGMKESAADPLAAFRAVNVEGTLNLARQAAAAGVKRFIFISSIKVNGEDTTLGNPYRHDDQPAPEDPYGQSKALAEAGLTELARETGMELVIIRPPLVYGPGVKGNFAAMMKLARKNLPLPLGAVQNQRSLVALDNLVDLIVTCIDHPQAANETFLVSDYHDVSTTELLTLMTQASGKKPRLLPVRMGLIQWSAAALGMKAVADRLCGSLQVDITHTMETLGWTPPVSVEEGVRRCLTKNGSCLTTRFALLVTMPLAGRRTLK